MKFLTEFHLETQGDFLMMKPKFYFNEEEERTISIDFDGVIHNDCLGSVSYTHLRAHETG
jgi:hypothetical protein